MIEQEMKQQMKNKLIPPSLVMDKLLKLEKPIKLTQFPTEDRILEKFQLRTQTCPPKQWLFADDNN